MHNKSYPNRFCAIFIGLVLLVSMQISSADEQVVSLDISENRGIADCATQPVSFLQQSYLLLEAPEIANAKAVLLLFVGGGGKLRVADGQLNITANNFLLRSRHLFAAAGFHVATMDAASDFLACKGGLRNRRDSGKYNKDMQAVVDDLRLRYPDLPLWLVGTSRGTNAAVQGAARIVPTIAGLVLTSAMTNPVTSTVFDAPLATITVPTLITAHERDACFVTPPVGAEYIRDALTGTTTVDIQKFSDGFPALSSNPCDATTPHGYLGIEPKVVERITNWISK